jgi:hypothetical protein
MLQRLRADTVFLVTDLISAVVGLLGGDMSRLVMEARETLEPVELWDEG